MFFHLREKLSQTWEHLLNPLPVFAATASAQADKHANAISFWQPLLLEKTLFDRKLVYVGHSR